MAKQLSLMEQDVTFLSLTDYPLPLFNADDEKEKGLPENAVRLAQMIAQHDGVFIASPEYNGSVTPLLKNMLDWVSRVPPEERHPYHTPVYALGAASPGKLGGMRSLAHLRQIMSALGAIVIPEQISVGSAGSAFDDKGEFERRARGGIPEQMRDTSGSDRPKAKAARVKHTSHWLAPMDLARCEW